MRAEEGFALASWTLIVALCCFMGGCAVQESMDRAKAIEVGVARWTVDAKTGAVKFEYLKGAR